MNAASALITAATSAQKELVAQGKVSLQKNTHTQLLSRIRIISIKETFFVHTDLIEFHWRSSHTFSILFY
jgi:hypothetical protein